MSEAITATNTLPTEHYGYSFDLPRHYGNYYEYSNCPIFVLDTQYHFCSGLELLKPMSSQTRWENCNLKTPSPVEGRKPNTFSVKSFPVKQSSSVPHGSSGTPTTQSGLSVSLQVLALRVLDTCVCAWWRTGFWLLGVRSWHL